MSKISTGVVDFVQYMRDDENATIRPGVRETQYSIARPAYVRDSLHPLFHNIVTPKHRRDNSPSTHIILSQSTQMLPCSSAIVLRLKQHSILSSRRSVERPFRDAP